MTTKMDFGHKLVALARRSTQQAGGHTHTSSSLSSLVSTLVPVLVVSTSVFCLFLVLRMSLRRVYRPRTYIGVIAERNRLHSSKRGFVNWFKDFITTPDEYVLRHESLDGYLFLRFFKMVILISFVGCLITWPILLPINATGGGGQTQLDMLSFSNVKNKNRLYAHTFVAWVFLGFVMLLVARERMFFIGLRQAYFLSPFHAARLSSRVVLFLSIPEHDRSERRLQEIFGPSAQRIWFATECDELRKLVDRADNDATKLEHNQIQISMQANKKRLEARKHGRSSESSSSPDAAHDTSEFQRVNPKNSQNQELKSLFGKRADTIDHCRNELKDLILEIKNHQQAHMDGRAKKISAAFVEFRTQGEAQSASQQIPNHQPLQMTPRFIGVQPNEIIWSNLRIHWLSRLVRYYLGWAIISATIAFWSIPVSAIGAISNISYLTSKVHFLSFINDIPPVVLGVVTGLLPTLLLTLLMALVPYFCRYLAKYAGEPTLSRVELKTQAWYFAFQVIQVFLVTTFTSGATAVGAQIANDPSSVTTLLAQNLPKASNFYISYFILYGFSLAAVRVIQLGPLLMIMVIGKLRDKTPRKMYERYINLTGIRWGSVYPKLTNLTVIAISYSCIAPLVLGFATIGLFLLYLGYRYSLLFVYTTRVDTKGECYARALQQLLTGVYLSEICLIGLFILQVAIGPLVLMVIFLVATALFHMSSNSAFGRLEVYLPSDLEKDANKTTLDAAQGLPKTEAGKDENEASQREHRIGGEHLDSNKQKSNIITKFFRPDIYASYYALKSLVPGSDEAHREDFPEYSYQDLRDAYLDPAVSAKVPTLWLVRDDMGVSRSECEENRAAGIPTSDAGAYFDKKGKIHWDEDSLTTAPIYQRAVWY